MTTRYKTYCWCSVRLKPTRPYANHLLCTFISVVFFFIYFFMYAPIFFQCQHFAVAAGLANYLQAHNTCVVLAARKLSEEGNGIIAPFLLPWCGRANEQHTTKTTVYICALANANHFSLNASLRMWICESMSPYLHIGVSIFHAFPLRESKALVYFAEETLKLTRLCICYLFKCLMHDWNVGVRKYKGSRYWHRGWLEHWVIKPTKAFGDSPPSQVAK